MNIPQEMATMLITTAASASPPATQEVYYLAQLDEEKKAMKMTDQQYADYVVEKGTKLDLKAASDTDVYVKDLHGLYDITVVAVRGNTKTQQTIQFSGLDYKPYGQGTWTSSFFGDSWKVDVEYSAVSRASMKMAMASPSHPTAPTWRCIPTVPSRQDTCTGHTAW